MPSPRAVDARCTARIQLWLTDRQERDRRQDADDYEDEDQCGDSSQRLVPFIHATSATKDLCGNHTADPGPVQHDVPEDAERQHDENPELKLPPLQIGRSP